MIGTKVVSIHDDSPCPAVGTIVNVVDEDRVIVSWDDYDQHWLASLDELIPHGRPLEYVTITEPELTPIFDSVAQDMPKLMRRSARLGRLLSRIAS